MRILGVGKGGLPCLFRKLGIEKQRGQAALPYPENSESAGAFKIV